MRIIKAQDRFHLEKAGRRAFPYVIEGEVAVNGQALGTGDQARITALSSLELSATRPSEVILIDLP